MIRSQALLGLETGMVFAVPVPADKEANSAMIKTAIDQALSEANEKNITGAEITPFLLKRLHEITGGESVESNVALIKNNAALATQIALAYAQTNVQHVP